MAPAGGPPPSHPYLGHRVAPVLGVARPLFVGGLDQQAAAERAGRDWAHRRQGRARAGRARGVCGQAGAEHWRKRRSKRGGREGRASKTHAKECFHSLRAFSLAKLSPPPRLSCSRAAGTRQGKTPTHLCVPTPHTHRAEGSALSLARVETPAFRSSRTHNVMSAAKKKTVCACVHDARLESGWAPRAQGAGDEALAFASQPNGKAGGCGGGTFFLHSPVAPASLPATVRGTVEAACMWWKQEAGDRAVRPRAQAFVLCESRRESVVPPPTLCRLHLAASTPGLQWHGCCPPVLGVSGGRAGLARARTEGWAIARWRTRNSGRPPLSLDTTASVSLTLPPPSHSSRSSRSSTRSRWTRRTVVRCVCVCWGEGCEWEEATR